MNIIRTALLAFLLVKGTATVSAQTAGTPVDIVVLQKDDPLPEHARKVGSVKVGDGMRFKCGYDVTLADLQGKAFALKGNVLRLTKIKYPDFYSTCYRMWADVYQVDDVSRLGMQSATDSLERSLLAPDAGYALLYIYRPPSFPGSAISYTVHIGDSITVKMRYGTGYVVQIPVAGRLRLWSRTERRKEVVLDIQPGKVYFVRCSVNMGAFVGVPEMKAMNNIRQAFSEYQDTRHLQPEDVNEEKEDAGGPSSQ